MKIDKNTVASVTYALKVDDQLVEKTDKENPLTFLVGAGSMIPGFEKNLLGKESGETYQMEVEPAEGYGEINDEAIVELDKNIFVVDGKMQDQLLEVGKVVNMQDQQGRPLQGTVKNIGDEKVKMDFNHQLAGKTLEFSGEVIEVRPATQEEIQHGHVHGAGGHQH